MFLEIFILTVAILLIALLAMGIRIIVKKNGRFVQTAIGKNKEMAKRGVFCASYEERKLRNKIDGKPTCSGGCC